MGNIFGARYTLGYLTHITGCSGRFLSDTAYDWLSKFS